MTNKSIRVIKKSTHYEIYINGKFYSTCDFNELKEEMEEIESDVNN